jgi:hypothetical protein
MYFPVKNIFLFISFLLSIFLIHTTASAQTQATTTVDQYSTKTLVDQARKQCQSVISTRGVSSVFIDEGVTVGIQRSIPPLGGGGGQVSVYDTGAISQLNYLSIISTSLEKILAERNFSDDCFKVLAMANAQKALTKNLKTNRDGIIENNLNNKEKIAENKVKKIIEQAKEGVEKSDDPYKESVLNGISLMTEKKTENLDFTYSPQEVESFASGRKRITASDFYEIQVMGNNPYTQTMNRINFLKEKIGEQVDITYETAKLSGGVLPQSACTKTVSGADPADVKWSDKDCEAWDEQPVIVTQERLKQIVNAPYNQAFSPSAELGMDGALSNINTRINNGTLFSQNVGDNFGTGSTNNSITDAEKIKNALINPATSTPPGTVSLGIMIYDAVNILYTSSTSSCVYLPVTERQRVSVEAITKRAELTAYKMDLETKWAEVLRNPKLDYTAFFIRLTVDLANKYSKDWVKTVLEDAKVKATACATAKANATISTTTTPTVNLP